MHTFCELIRFYGAIYSQNFKYSNLIITIFIYFIINFKVYICVYICFFLLNSHLVRNGKGNLHWHYNVIRILNEKFRVLTAKFLRIHITLIGFDDVFFVGQITLPFEFVCNDVHFSLPFLSLLTLRPLNLIRDQMCYNYAETCQNIIQTLLLYMT